MYQTPGKENENITNEESYLSEIYQHYMYYLHRYQAIYIFSNTFFSFALILLHIFSLLILSFFFVYDAWKIRNSFFFALYFFLFWLGVNWAADKYIAFSNITRKQFVSIKNLSLYIIFSENNAWCMVNRMKQRLKKTVVVATLN